MLWSLISAIVGKGIFTIRPSAQSILTLGVVRACVLFILRTVPLTRRPSVVTISTLSLPYNGCNAASALVISTFYRSSVDDNASTRRASASGEGKVWGQSIATGKDYLAYRNSSYILAEALKGHFGYVSKF
jgi:hypothetical protein